MRQQLQVSIVVHIGEFNIGFAEVPYYTSFHFPAVPYTSRQTCHDLDTVAL